MSTPSYLSKLAKPVDWNTDSNFGVETPLASARNDGPAPAASAQRNQFASDRRPFNDIAKGFDPAMTQDQYDDLRWQYFQTHVRQNFDPTQQTAAWQDFKSKTERPRLIQSPTMAKLKLGTLSAMERSAELAGKADMVPTRTQQVLQNQKQQLISMMTHDGISTGLAEGFGKAVPDLAVFAGIEAMTQGLGTGLAADLEGVPLAGDVAKILSEQRLAMRLSKGGLTFGTFEAATADKGTSPGYAFIKGFGTGVVWDAGLMGLGKVLGGTKGLAKELLNKKASQVVADLATPRDTEAELNVALAKPQTREADKVAATHVQGGLQQAREQALPLQIGIDNSRKTARVTGINGSKAGFSIDIEPYHEEAVAEQLKQILANGGEVHAVFGNELNRQQVVRTLQMIRGLRNDQVYRLSLLKTALDEHGDVLDAKKFTQDQREQFLQDIDRQLAKLARQKQDALIERVEQSQVQEPLAQEQPKPRRPRAKTTPDVAPLANDGMVQAGGKQYPVFTMRNGTLGSKGLFADVTETQEPGATGLRRPSVPRRLYLANDGEIRSFSTALGAPVKKGSPGNEWIPKDEGERAQAWTLMQKALKTSAGATDVDTIKAQQELKKFVMDSVSSPPAAAAKDEVQYSSDPKTPGLVQAQPDFVDTVPSKAQVDMILATHETPDGQRLTRGEQVTRSKQIMSLWNSTLPQSTKEINALDLRDTGLDFLVPRDWQSLVREPKALETEDTATASFSEAKPPEGEVSTPTAETERQEVPDLSATVPVSDALRFLSPTAKVKRNILEIRSGRQTLGKFFGTDENVRAMAMMANRPLITAKSAAHSALKLGLHIPTDVVSGISDEAAVSGIRVIPWGIKGTRRDIASSLYHEDLHIQLNMLRMLDDKRNIFRDIAEVNAKPEVRSSLKAVTQRVTETFDDIGEGLAREFGAYRQAKPELLIEEAFVHPASAIRTGNIERLKQFAHWDTSVDRVREAVDWLAGAQRERIAQLPDTQELRAFATRLDDLMRRTGPERFQRWLDAAMRQEKSIHYDPERMAWMLRDEVGRSTSIEADHAESLLKKIPDQLETLAGFEEQVPSETIQFEAMGWRGPMFERASVVQGTMDKPTPYFMPKSEDSFKGIRAVTATFEPMLGWAARTEEAFKKRGVDLGLFDLVKDVDDAARLGAQWQEDMYTSAAKHIPADANRAIAMMPFMQAEESRLPLMQKQFGVDDAFMQNVRGLRQWMQDFQTSTGIQVQNYLRKDLGRLQNMNYSVQAVWPRGLDKSELSRMAKAIVNKEINPQDPHIGHLTSWLIREGFDAKFTEVPLAKLRQLVTKTDADGKPILGVLRANVENYINYMRGIPDMTQRIMLNAVGDFQKGLGKAFAKVNTQFGTKLPEQFNYPGDTLQKYMLLSYVGGLGLRPAIWARDAMQGVTNTLPIIGPVKFMKGVAKLFEPGSWDFANEAGAFLGRHNFGSLYGDIFQELSPQSGGAIDKLVDYSGKLLSPSRWAHNVARAVAFHGEYDSALEAVRLFRANKISVGDLLEKTSMWFFDAPLQRRLLRDVLDKEGGMTDLAAKETRGQGAAGLGGKTQGWKLSHEDVAKKIALETVDHTLWAYRRGTQPLFLRSGIGRIFGQYGLWPMSYFDYLRRLGGKLAEHPRMATRSLGLWYAANQLASATFSAAGADVSKWFFISPAGFGGSPHLEMAQAMGQALENSQEGRAARKTILEYPMNFIPAYLELKNVSRYISEDTGFFNDDWSLTDNAIRILGMHPKSQDLQLTPEEELEYQTGFSHRR